jgi:muconolactone delta-isomerase
MTKMLTLCAVTPLPPDQMDRLMLEEVEVVTRQYIEGKLEQFWRREDGKGGVLIYNTGSTVEAEAWVRELPLTRESYLTYELIPIGPLTQLKFLLQAVKARA